MSDRIGAIILAAGSSSRMGSAGLKQLLQFHGESLLRRAIRTAEGAGLDPIVVTLGAFADRIRADIAEQHIRLVENPRWEAGMGSTLRAGLSGLLACAAEIDAVVIALCDQPLVTSEDLRRLVEAFHKTGKPLVASGYGETVGVPALIEKRYFDRVNKLPDAAGAKALFAGNSENVAVVAMPNAALDIDSPEDLQQMSDGIDSAET